jgi:hypothetical protein
MHIATGGKTTAVLLCAGLVLPAACHDGSQQGVRYMGDITTERGPDTQNHVARLTLSTDSSVVRPGRPVVLTLVLANDGSAPVLFPRSSIWFEYDYAVANSAGEPVALTPLGQEKQRSLQEQGGTLLEIQPGAKMTSTVEITSLYNLSRPGTYVLTASKTLPSPAGEGFVKIASNSVTIKVEAGPGQAEPR